MQLTVAVIASVLAAGGKLSASIVPALLFAAMATISVFLIVQEHRRASANRPEDLLLKALWDTIHTHQRIYREISAKYPEPSKYPLSSTSWPTWGQPWHHADATLFCGVRLL